MSLVEHARTELKACGQYDEDAEFAEALIKAVEAFASYGHSGGSAGVGVHMLHDLLQFKPLSPLTNDPDEWLHIEEDLAGDAITWQNRRQPDAFSTDGGKTYYCLDDPENWIDGRQKPRDEWKTHISKSK
jgi:hypothetical protein